jgi:hypothetical protein
VRNGQVEIVDDKGVRWYCLFTILAMEFASDALPTGWC